MIKIAHRGVSGHFPENTIPAFLAAVNNYDAIELDVVKLKCGTIAVFHDQRIERIFAESGYINDFSYEEPLKMKTHSGINIPTLEEVIIATENKIIINIELKDKNIYEDVAKIIQKYIKIGWSYDNFIISSFFHKDTLMFKKIIPQIKTGVIMDGKPIMLSKVATDANADFLNLSKDFIDQEIIDDAHKNNIKVMVWTCNNSEDIERMKKLNVDGIFSNFPELI